MAPKKLQPFKDIEAKWKRVRSRLRVELGENAYRTWLRPLTLKGMNGDEVVMVVPGDNMRRWVLERCGDRLQDLWCRESSDIKGISIQVSKPENRENQRRVVARQEARYMNNSYINRVPGDDESRLVNRLNPRFTFENFIVGQSNQFACSAASRVCTSEARSAGFNPLYIYGGVGLGKTHLMNAIAWEIRACSPMRQVLYLSAEKFMVQFVKAVRNDRADSFKETFRAVDVLMIDDIQFIANKRSTQEEFFHTFDALMDRNRQIVVSADRPPGDLESMNERLKSRLGGGLVANIHAADYELRLEVLKSKLALAIREARVANLSTDDIPLAVMQYVATNITSNIRELEGALNRIVAQIEMIDRPVTVEIAKERLRDLLRSNDRRISVEEIQRAVAEHYGITVADLLSNCKQRAIARPRQVAMYLVKRLTNRSLPDIGRKFGGRDHTTIMHGVRRITQLMNENEVFADEVEKLERSLTA